jgi:hypothetical protein
VDEVKYYDHIQGLFLWARFVGKLTWVGSHAPTNIPSSKYFLLYNQTNDCNSVSLGVYFCLSFWTMSFNTILHTVGQNRQKMSI